MTTETRTRPKRRTALPMAALALAGLTSFITSRTMSLDGLPDIGDPFDVGAFCRPIPDETNAFAIYREANRQLTKEPQDLQGHWETAGESERKWLTENRDALRLWKRGTERHDARYVSPRALNFATPLPVVQGQRLFARMATLEGTRLEAEGKFDEALEWYLAVLRASRHMGNHGVAIERLVGIAMHAMASKRLSSLAGRPEVDASTIRRALDSALAIDAMTPAASDLFKCEYLGFIHSVDDPAFDDSSAIGSPAPPEWKTPMGKVWFRIVRMFKKEPERSRRVFRLIIANHLAYCDRPAGRRPPKVTPDPQLKDAARDLVSGLYAVDETAPASARALPPGDLGRWFASTIYAEVYMPALGAVEKALAREQSAQANLVIALANELYAREHGKHPETVEELVGPYLKELPEGYSPPK